METEELKKAVESLLFITDQPLPLARLKALLGVREEEPVAAAIQALRDDYDARGAAMQVLEIAEGFQMATRPVHAGLVRKLYADRMTMRLSSAALETLSIVAYKQPITRAEIEEIRGVEVIAALETLLEKRLVKVAGRKETVGRPLLYGTTADFLRHFGLKNLGEMPALESLQPPPEPSAKDAPADAPGPASPEGSRAEETAPTSAASMELPPSEGEPQ